MSFDGIATRAILSEIKPYIEGARINKISQPGKNEIILTLYQPKVPQNGLWRKTVRFFISVSGNHPCIYLTDQGKENPINAPNFCMFLRKHIQNAVISGIRQQSMDRVVFLDLDTYDELGDQKKLSLVIELMGKYSNVILIDRDDNRILDALKRVTMDMSSIRQVQSGMIYETIADEKYDISREYLLPSQILPMIEKPFRLFQLFFRYYTGFGPVIARDILFRAGIDLESRTSDISVEDAKKLDETFGQYVEKILNNRFSPVAIYQDKRRIAFYVLPVQYLGSDRKIFPSVSHLLEEVYQSSAKEDAVGLRANELKKIILQKLNRNAHKIERLQFDLEEAKDRDQFKLYGDLLSANVHRIQKGMTEITVENFYEDMERINIAISPKHSAWDNVQLQYRKFSKLKKRERVIQSELPKIEEEIIYLNSLIDALNRVEKNAEIEDIRDEMVAMKLIRKRTKKKSSVQKSKPLHFVTENKVHIYVGKNNQQNDYLTLKVANKEDYFFHAKDIPGSHVIMRDENVTEEDIRVAAFLAAIHSQGASEKVVSVDYTKKKNVRKARSAKPGMVYYENFTTLQIETDLFRMEDIKLEK